MTEQGAITCGSAYADLYGYARWSWYADRVLADHDDEGLRAEEGRGAEEACKGFGGGQGGGRPQQARGAGGGQGGGGGNNWSSGGGQQRSGYAGGSRGGDDYGQPRGGNAPRSAPPANEGFDDDDIPF